MRCHACGMSFKGNVTKCQCTYCLEHPEIHRCMRCCYSLAPHESRPLRLTEDKLTFICYRCMLSYPVGPPDQCSCCRESFLCRTCCYHDGSPCCSIVPIDFRTSPLLFAYPIIQKDKQDRGLGWVERDNSEGLLTKLGSGTKFKLNPKGFTINPSHRFIATELEFLNYKDARNLNVVLKQWNCNVVEDSSIARGYLVDNPHTDRYSLKTFEINTAPACGDAVLWQLTDICEALNNAKAKVSMSCGIHAHVDCRDFGYQELQKLIRVYCNIEAALFAAVHYSRFNNEFCTPCGNIFYDRFIKGVKPDTKGLKQHLIAGVYGTSATRMVPGRFRGTNSVAFHARRQDHYGRVDHLDRNPMRYSALNLHSYFLRGTVEFRLHHASTDLKEIWGWNKLLVDLFDSIYSIPEQKLTKILEVDTGEIVGAMDLINVNGFKRTDLARTSIAKGVVILRSLLSDTSFQILLNKIDLACTHPEIATSKVLPCNVKKVEV